MIRNRQFHGDVKVHVGFFVCLFVLSRWQCDTAVCLMLRVVIVRTLSLVTVSVFWCACLICYCAARAHANGKYTLSHEPQRRTCSLFSGGTNTWPLALVESDLFVRRRGDSPSVWVVSAGAAAAVRANPLATLVTFVMGPSLGSAHRCPNESPEGLAVPHLRTPDWSERRRRILPCLR